MTEDDPLKLYDYLLIDAVKACENPGISVIARQLRCPRSFVTDRLEHLLSLGYISVAEGELSLTEKGEEAHIPLTHLRRDEAALSQPPTQPMAFDWTQLYVPDPGSFK